MSYKYVPRISIFLVSGISKNLILIQTDILYDVPGVFFNNRVCVFFNNRVSVHPPLGVCVLLNRQRKKYLLCGINQVSSPKIIGTLKNLFFRVSRATYVNTYDFERKQLTSFHISVNSVENDIVFQKAAVFEV